MQMRKKGAFSIGEVPTLAVTLGVIAIVLGLVATILTQVQATQTAGSYAFNITRSGLQAQNTLSSWQATWAVIFAAAAVLGVIAAYLIFRG